MGRGGAVIETEEIDAVIFDMDGVVTDTASVHAQAWARMFDRFLRDRASRSGEAFRPFTEDDYRRFVDGKPRYDGVRSFLAARGITLAEGNPADPSDAQTVCGLGNRKDRDFLDRLRTDGVRAFQSTIALIDELRRAGVRTAVISASRNLEAVLAAAGVGERFDVRLGGAEAERLGLKGKPQPAIFLEATRRLGAVPRRAAVVEDALAGVEAGRRGGFRLVVGVDRLGHPAELEAAGADVVVKDLAEVSVDERQRLVRDLPDAFSQLDEIRQRLAGRSAAVFLDYDGTLTPIVERPEDALLADTVRRGLERLASLLPVAVISGRDLTDVRRMVGLDGIAYAGSHGLDIVVPGGTSERYGGEFAPELDAAEAELRQSLEPIAGARLERKRSTIAVHVRQVAEAQVRDAEGIVDTVARAHPRLRAIRGKKVLELCPDIEWDKCRAVMRLLHILGLDRPEVVPVYLGDDVTDEDAFRALRARGLGLVVRGEDDDRPTSASYSLKHVGDVARFLEELMSAAEGPFRGQSSRRDSVESP
jgi:alpha,alpha-trehalase